MNEDFDSDFKLVSSYLFSPLILAVLRLLIALFTLVTSIFCLVWESVKTHKAPSCVACYCVEYSHRICSLASFRISQTSLSLGCAHIFSRRVCRQFHTP